MTDTASQGAEILPFDAARRRIVTLTVSDRIQALRWLDSARELGIRAVRVFDPEPGDGATVDPFLLIYRDGEVFATWGIARRRHGYELWRTGCGTTIGAFDGLAMALDLIAGWGAAGARVRTLQIGQAQA